jgi:flagellar biosynthesis/type III secretory pathway protein FliH
MDWHKTLPLCYEGMKDAGKAKETTFKDSARATKSAAKDAAHATDRVATDTLKGTEKASKKTARANARAGKKTGKEIGKGAEVGRAEKVFQSESKVTASQSGLITYTITACKTMRRFPSSLMFCEVIAKTHEVHRISSSTGKVYTLASRFCRLR